MVAARVGIVMGARGRHEVDVLLVRGRVRGGGRGKGWGWGRGWDCGRVAVGVRVGVRVGPGLGLRTTPLPLPLPLAHLLQAAQEAEALSGGHRAHGQSRDLAL